MNIRQDIDEPGFAKAGRLIRENWLLLFAMHPLLRTLLLAEPPTETTQFQLVERFQWLSCWILEAAIIVMAMRSGFRVKLFLGELSPGPKLLLAIWFAAMAITTARAEYFELAIRGMAEWVMHGLFAMAVWHLVVRDSPRFSTMFDRFAELTPWATSLAGLIAMWLVFSIGLSSDYPFGTDIPGFSHIRHSGYIFAPAMMLCLCRLAASPDAPRIPMFLLGLNVALCLWFGSRGPFLGVICGMATAMVLYSSFRSPTFLIRGAFAGLAGAIASVFVPSPDNQGFNAIRRFLDGSADPSAFSSGRTEFWKDAAGLILDRPFFGYGGGHFQFVSDAAKNTYRHPHDFILQVMFDWGVVGGGAFLGLLALAWVIISGVRKDGDRVTNTGLIGAVCMLSFALIDGILFYPYTIEITIVFLIASLLPLTGRARSETSDASFLSLRPRPGS
jgi:O-antigen ligase